jgi:hypothetical protein
MYKYIYLNASSFDFSLEYKTYNESLVYNTIGILDCNYDDNQILLYDILIDVILRDIFG